MPRVRTIGVFCFIAILGAGLGYAFRRPTHSASRDEEVVRLSISPDALNMGTVWEDDHFTWTVTIENQEAVPIEITSFSRSCNCLSIEPESFVLGPGERRELHLKIDLLAKQTTSSGDVSISLIPRLKIMPGTEMGKRRPPKWTVKGRVRRVLTLDRLVNLGRHSELSQPLQVRSIPLEVLVPLESLSVECGLRNFTASIELPSTGVGKTLLRVAQSTSLPIGTIQGTITLKPVQSKGEALPARRLEVIGNIVADVESVPPAVQVGGRRLGELFEEMVVLRSITGKAMGPVRTEAEGEGLMIEATEESGRYRIRQKVCNVGSRTNSARFITASGNHSVTITVPVSYTGINVE